jgi:hypothetical protein
MTEHPLRPLRGHLMGKRGELSIYISIMTGLHRLDRIVMYCFEWAVQ